MRRDCQFAAGAYLPFVVSWVVAKRGGAIDETSERHDRGAAPRVRGAFQKRWIHKLVRGPCLQLGLCGPGVLLACHVAHLGVHVLLYRCLLCRRAPLRADAWAEAAAERAPCRGQPMALGFGPPRAGELGAVLRAVRGGHPRARACQLGLRRYLRCLSCPWP